MREDNPATEIMNALSECASACGVVCQIPSEAQREAVLDAVSWFIEAAPLDDLPTVQSVGLSKQALREASTIAANLKAAVLSWDGATAPPPSLVRLAREFLGCVGMHEIGGEDATSTPETTDAREALVYLVSDMGDGIGMLMMLSGRVSADVPRESLLERFAAFEAAYGPLAELQAAGRLETGGGILSPELGEQIMRLGALLRLPPESTEAEDAAIEIRALAEQCLQALLPAHFFSP